MSLIRYTPYSLANLQQQINRMFDQADMGGGSEGLGGGMFAPAVDVKEDAEAYTILLEAPGIKQENLSITLQENLLTIRGHKEQKQEQAEGQYRRVECSYGTFARSLTLPRNIDSNAVTANLQNGVLEVRLPKQEEARPRQINIGVMGHSHEAQSIETQSSTQAIGSELSGAGTSTTPTTISVASGDGATESEASGEVPTGTSSGTSRTRSPRTSSTKASSSGSGRTKKSKTSGDSS